MDVKDVVCVVPTSLQGNCPFKADLTRVKQQKYEYFP